MRRVLFNLPRLGEPLLINSLAAPPIDWHRALVIMAFTITSRIMPIAPGNTFKVQSNYISVSDWALFPITSPVEIVLV